MEVDAVSRQGKGKKKSGKGKKGGKKRKEKKATQEVKKVDDLNPSSNTSTQQQILSQVNKIGCADEGLWIFSLEDSQKRWYTVNWKDQSRSNPTEK